MKKVILYFAFLAVASGVVFLLAFTLGRRPTLEQELARRTIMERGTESLTIDSIQDPEPEKSEEPEEEIPAPTVQSIAEDVTTTRFPSLEAGMVLLLDGGLLSAAGDYDYFSPRRFLEGLESFLTHPPASVRIGLQTLSASTAGDCGGGRQLLPCDLWSAGEPAAALRSAGPVDGPRGISRGLEEGAAGLSGVPGDRAVVLVTAGGEECGGDPCRLVEDLRSDGSPLGVFVIALGPPPGYMPAEAPLPPWQSRLECLAEGGRGRLFRVSSPRELEETLRAVVASLRPNVTVRAFHGDREIQGASVGDREAWGAAAGTGKAVYRFPASFSIPAGTVDLRVWYHGEEKRLEGIGLAADERIDVLVNFHSGELYIETKDAAGEELVGDTSGLDCYWGVEVFAADNPLSGAGSSCAFPAYFVLPPGSYTVRVWNGEREHWLDDVRVRKGKTAVEKVAFKEEQGSAP